jgi:2-iminoacetate synthase ThiH
MTDTAFSLEPVDQADMDDLAERGIEWIKERLEQANLHIANVREIYALAEQQELDKEERYALLAYRVLVDLVQMTQTILEERREQPAPSHIVDVTGHNFDA